ILAGQSRREKWTRARANGVRSVTGAGMLMRAAAFFLLSALIGLLAARSGASQSPVVADCREWTQCRRLALDAAERHDYEAFHDLAWRAVQTGPRQDPALMYLLARAQALSGRPHDALIMIQRLAEMGVAPDASTNDDFVRTRQLPGWPDLLARIGGLSHPVSPPAASSTAIPAPIPAPIP